MKVTSVSVYASNMVDPINLSYRDPRAQNPYSAKEILGLDADEIVAKFYGTSSINNDAYYDLSLRKRDVVVKIGLNPDFATGKSYAELRDDLYRLISSSRTGAITLKFNNGATTVAIISGFVTKFESPLNTRTPEVQMTINCRYPMLRAPAEENLDISGLNPAATVVTDALSTAPHGFRFGLIFSDNIVDFSIKDAAAASWGFEVNLIGSSMGEFLPGDELHFSSEYNNKYLFMIRGLDIIQLVDRIIPTSVWPILFPGANTFVCSQFVAWDYIVHYPTYWGV